MKKISLIFSSIFLALFLIGCSGSESGKIAESPHKVRENDRIKGNVNAILTLAEYSDFQCPACKLYHPIVKEVVAAFPDDLRVVYRHFPLVTIHDNALLAAQASEAAGQQGKFWEYHDYLFEQQQKWASLGRPWDTFVEYAKNIGLDTDRFEEDLESDVVEDKVDQDREAAKALRLNGTPSFFLNGKRVQNPTSLDEFKQVIQKELDIFKGKKDS